MFVTSSFPRWLIKATADGERDNGEIGDGAMVDRNAPTAVALPPGTVTELGLGELHGCAIVDGNARCWGDAPPGNGLPASSLPVAASLPSPVTAIGGGAGETCAVANGNVYCWGNEIQGSLGNGAAGSTQLPALVTLPVSAVGVDVANDHVMAWLVDGSIRVWGHNDNGVFGTGMTTPASSDVPLLSGVSNTQAALAGWHACAIIGGGAQCWGRGTGGELGDGNGTDSASPVSVSGLASGVDVIATGGGPVDRDISCAVVAGAAWCWGNGVYGRLGNNQTANSLAPVAVVGIPSDVVQLAIGYGHTCSRHRDGTVRCWGRGDSGELGDGAGTSSMTAVLVPTP